MQLLLRPAQVVLRQRRRQQRQQQLQLLPLPAQAPLQHQRQYQKRLGQEANARRCRRPDAAVRGAARTYSARIALIA